MNHKDTKAQTTKGFAISLRQPGPLFLCVFASLWFSVWLVRARAAESPATNDYSAVDALIAKHCLDCHAAQDPEGKLIMESFDDLMRGGESGPVIVPGQSAESLLVKMIEGKMEKEGKKKIMPPGKRKKLEPEEIALIRSWIDAGAKAPAVSKSKELVVPRITPRVPPRKAINALAHSGSKKLIAVARYGVVELLSAETRARVRNLEGHRGNVNALAFSADRKHLFAAAGEPGLFGEVRQWDLADGKLVRTFEGHKDALYALAVSPDGKTLATGGYDQKIKFWNIETGEEMKTLSGHNGCVFDLAFRPDGKILASASADRTVKLWDVASGERRDTLAQSLKELYAVAFSPDGKRLVAGGVDNRIRVWEISETAAETSNPLRESRFAHEGAILNLIYSGDGKMLLSSADDRTIKLWDAAEIKERLLLEKQPDWAPAITFASDNKAIVVGRLDGTMGFYDATSGKILPPPKPELVRVEPPGIQRGVETKLKLAGSNLANVTQLKLHHSKLTGELMQEPEPKAKEAWIKVLAASDLARGPYEISVEGPGGESSKIKLYVDQLPQVIEAESNAETNLLVTPPINIWGALDPAGDSDWFDFEAKAGQTIIFDLAAKSLDSKANGVLTLADATGKVLASNNDFDSADPMLAYTFTLDGRYTIRVHDLMLGGSVNHYYRLSVGALPYVTGSFPLSVPVNTETDVELIGFNLPPDRSVRIKAEQPGEIALPVDPEQFRSRKTFKVIVAEGSEVIEVEPNDRPAEATKVNAPGAVGGRIFSPHQSSDVDLFRFEAKAGQSWVIETVAAQRGSPVDTKIELLHADGRPVERLLLQAVRNSAVTFRGIDSTTADCRVENWEEMELNEFLYLQGEVVKLFRAPQGPDSGFLFYTVNGKRRAYFDTSATAHALDEPCYVVEPHPPGARLAATGLPIFTLYYANDDDGERKLGTDSKVHFAVPADGSYFVRVTDTRGQGGERFAYRLVLREAKPDFKVTLDGANPTVNAGSGQSFSVKADRMDGFDGEIKVEIAHLPAGFTASTPLVIQAGHNEAKGTLHAALDAPNPGTNTSKVTATAMLNGKPAVKDVNNFGAIKLGDKPKLFVFLEPCRDMNSTSRSTNAENKTLELTLAPGQTIPALLRVKRNGHDDLVTFTVENLPHGVIVDNIGLNGVLIPKGDDERQIFLTAAKWVPETDRLCYALENQAGKQTSVPLMLHVRKPSSKGTASAK